MRDKDQTILESLYNSIRLEKFYNSRKPLNGYLDAEEIIGKRVWVHTNRTHRNQGYNGMIGIYGTNSKGNRTGSPLNYTNEIRLKQPIVFETSEKGSERIKNTGKRTLVAGVSGVVIETGTEKDNTGFLEIGYNPDVGYFFEILDPEKKKIIGADEVYFSSYEDGRYVMMAKNPKTEIVKD
jgi:hypothetical protein